MIRLFCFAFALVAAGSVMPSAAKPKWLSAPAATQSSAPVQSFVSNDQPIDLREATGQEAAWLKAFDVEAGKFSYTLQLVDEDESASVYRLAYPSPFESPWPQNNTVPAELYLPRQQGTGGGQMRAAIVLDIMDGSAILARGMARGLCENGVAALYVPMAYYNQRRPKGDPHIRAFNADPTRALDALRQTVMDIRRAKAILAGRPEIDAGHIGITGISLGGITASLAAGVDGTFDRVVPILAGGDIAALIFHTRETRGIRQKLQEKGVNVEQLEQILAPVEPMHFASRIEPSRCLMINAAQDEVIPRWTTDALRKAIGSPRIIWSPAGHYSSVMYLPAIRQTAARFLRGETVHKLEM